MQLKKSRIANIVSSIHNKSKNKLKNKPDQPKEQTKKQRTGKKERKEKKSVFNSIRFKLSFAITLPVAFLIASGLISYIKTSDGLEESYLNSSTLAMEMSAEYMDFIYENTKKDYNRYLTDIQLIDYLNARIGSDEDGVKIFNKNMAELYGQQATSNFVSNIHIITDQVKYLSTESSTIPDMYAKIMKSEDGKFIEKNKKTYMMLGKWDPEIDKLLNVDPDSYALRIVKKIPSTAGVMIIDLDKSEFNKVLKKLKLGTGSLVSFVTQDGDCIHMKDKDTTISDEELSEMALQYYKEVSGKSERIGSSSKKINGTGYSCMYAKVGATKAIITAFVPTSTVLASATEVGRLTIVMIIVASIIALFVGFLIATGIIKTINYIIVNISKVTKGDLTVQFHVKRKDEFLVLANELTGMVQHTKQLFEKVDNISSELTVAAKDVADSSGEFVQSAENIKEAAREIEVGVTQQADDAVDCLQEMDVLSTKIESLNMNADKITSIIQKTSATINHGISYMNKMNDKTRSTTDITNNVIHTIELLEDKSNSIRGIVSVINDISEQTNLLSLNASIEAARAGESGRGFAVVADEIRKLAELSLSSANKINSIIEEIIDDTKKAVNTAKDAEIVVKEQEVAVKDTTKSFSEIDDQVVHLMSEMEEILKGINEMDQSRMGTLTAIESISAVSQQSASSSTTVTEAAAHQFEVVVKLDLMAKELSKYAKELEVSINQFTIK